MRLLLSAALLALASLAALAARGQTVEAQEGPFDRLAIVNAMLIPGHGGPADGPADIVIEGDRIAHIRSYNGATGRPDDAPLPHADRVIDASGMTVMPGLIDLHTHIRSDELPLQYVYSMKLAHGVTTMVNGAGRGWENALEQQRLARANRITAPRMYPIRDWGPARAATRKSAITLRREDPGLVQTGFTADLLVVDGDPPENLRFLYPFGALDRVEGEIVRRGGIRWTIRAGVVFDNAVLIEDVVETVAEAKANWSDPVPPLFEPRFTSGDQQD